jgi:hypothetical protein
VAVFSDNLAEFIFDYEFGLSVLSEFATSLHGVGLPIVQRISTAGSVGLNRPPVALSTVTCGLRGMFFPG